MYTSNFCFAAFIGLASALPRPQLNLTDVADGLTLPTLSPRKEGLGLPYPLSEVELPDALKETLHSITEGAKLMRRQLDLPIDSIEDTPSLIPSIPGVTEPLTSNAPPLPILQVPTPPLESPPYNGSDIQPKKIGYFWTGSGDNMHKDFLASYSLDDDTFGTLLKVTDVETSGNSPHHLGMSPNHRSIAFANNIEGVSKDGSTLWGGGLLSLLKTQDTGFYFDVSNPYDPKFTKSDRATLASIADEVVAKPDGGFFITYMGSAAGTSPGRLIETDADYNIIHQWPEDVDGTLNILESQFSPHGLSIDFDNGVMLTSDFVVPYTILKPTTGIQRADTLRLWNLEDRTIISTIDIPEVCPSRSITFIGAADFDFPGWRYPRRQVHPRQQRIGCPCHCCSPWSSLDHLSFP